MQEKEDVYKGWLVSPSIFKRAFAVWGHYMLANIIIGLTCGLLVLLGGILIGMFAN